MLMICLWFKYHTCRIIFPFFLILIRLLPGTFLAVRVLTQEAKWIETNNIHLHGDNIFLFCLCFCHTNLSFHFETRITPNLFFVTYPKKKIVISDFTLKSDLIYAKSDLCLWNRICVYETSFVFMRSGICFNYETNKYTHREVPYYRR